MAKFSASGNSDQTAWLVSFRVSLQAILGPNSYRIGIGFHMQIVKALQKSLARSRQPQTAKGKRQVSAAPNF